MRVLLWPGLFTLSRPLLSLCVLLVLSGLTFVSVLQLRFEDDITASFSSGSGHAEAYFDFLQSNEGVSPPILVVFRSPEPFDADGYGALQEMQFEFALIEEVATVVSVASARFPSWHQIYPDEPVLPFELDLDAIEERAAAYENLGLQPRLALSPDRRTALFAIGLRGGFTDGLLSEFRQVADRASLGGYSIDVTGAQTIGPEMVRALQTDLLVFNSAAAVVALVVAWLVLGNLRLVALTVVPAFCAAYFSLALFFLLGLKITVLNNAIPLLVMVLALADAVHLILNMQNRTGVSGKMERVRKTYLEVGPACALTGVTTSIAFFMIALTDNAQTREMALLGAASVLVGYVVAMAVFCLLAPRMWPLEAGQRISIRFALPPSLISLIAKKSRAIRLLSYLISVAAVIGLITVEPWFKMDDNLPATSAMRNVNEVITKDFGGFYPLWFELEAQSEQGFEAPDDWQRLVNLVNVIETASPHATNLSLVSLAKWLDRPDRLPSREDIENWPSDTKDVFLSSNGKIARVMTLVPEPMFDRRVLAAQDTLEEAVRGASNAAIVGQPMIMRYDTLDLVRQHAFGLAAACLATVLVIAAYYRSFGLVRILLLPNLLPVAIAIAALHIINEGQLTPAALLAVTIAFGIAVDNSIHFINRYSLEKKKQDTPQQALEATIAETGQAMIITTVLICSGLAVTLASAFFTVKLFGMLLIVTFLAALLGDLLLLPSLIAKEEGSGAERVGSGSRNS